jgi:hypothetical protein
MEETLSPKGIETTPLQDAKSVLSDRHRIVLLVVMTLSFTTMYTESISETYIIQTSYGRSPLFYGILMFGWCGALIIGVMLSATGEELLRPTLKIVGAYFMLPFLAAALLIVAGTPLVKDVWWYVCTRSLTMIGQGLSEGAAENVFMQNVEQYAGTASAILSFGQFAIAGALSYGTSAIVLHFGPVGSLCTIASLVLLYSSIFLLGFGVYPPPWFYELDKARKEEGGANNEEVEEVKARKKVPLSRRHAMMCCCGGGPS